MYVFVKTERYELRVLKSTPTSLSDVYISKMLPLQSARYFTSDLNFCISFTPKGPRLSFSMYVNTRFFRSCSFTSSFSI